MTKTVALYARVSTDAQNTLNQERELRAVAERAGRRVVEGEAGGIRGLVWEGGPGLRGVAGGPRGRIRQFQGVEWGPARRGKTQPLRGWPPRRAPRYPEPQSQVVPVSDRSTRS